MFGGIEGTLGEAASWVIGILGAIAAIWGLFRARRARAKHGFPVKPMWAEMTLAGIAVVAILGFIALLNCYDIPIRRLAA